MIGIVDAAVSSGSGESEKSWRNYNGATAGRGQISPVSEGIASNTYRKIRKK